MNRLCTILIIFGLLWPSTAWARVENCEGVGALSPEQAGEYVFQILALAQGNVEGQIKESPLCPQQILSLLDIASDFGVAINPSVEKQIRTTVEALSNDGGEGDAPASEPPRIEVADPIVAKAACGAEGAEVTIDARAVDGAGAPLATSIQRDGNLIASPSFFPIGETGITVFAEDAEGHGVAKDLTVRVTQDDCGPPPEPMTPPPLPPNRPDPLVVVKKPPQITVSEVIEGAINLNATQVTLTARATDGEGRSIPVTYTLEDGTQIDASHQFPLGVTSVRASATDSNGKTVEKWFEVSVTSQTNQTQAYPNWDELETFEPTQPALDYDAPESWLIANEYLVIFKDFNDELTRENIASQLDLSAHQIGRIFDNAFLGFELFASKSDAEKIQSEHAERVSIGQNFYFETSSDVIDAKQSAVIDWLDRSDEILDGNLRREEEIKDVNLYIVDTGVRDDHIVFDEKKILWRGVSAGTGGGSAYACSRHGTAMAALAGSSVFSATARANIIDVNVAPCEEGISPNEGVKIPLADVVTGLDWIMSQESCEPGEPCAPFVVNMSFGAPAAWQLLEDDPNYQRSMALEFAIQSLLENTNAIVIVAAGNAGRNACDIVPAFMPEVVTVGGVDLEGKLWSRSNWGECVNAYALALEQATADAMDASEIRKDQGTSGAAAIVSGLAAHWLAAGQDREKVISALMAYPTDETALAAHKSTDAASEPSKEAAEAYSAVNINDVYGCYVKSPDGVLELRKAPQADAEKLASLKNGERVSVLSKNNRWRQIRTQQGVIGWSAATGKYGTYLWDIKDNTICD